MDLNLPADLFLDFGLDDFGFVETLQSEDVLWSLLGADHVDPAKLALSKRAADVK